MRVMNSIEELLLNTKPGCVLLGATFACLSAYIFYTVLPAPVTTAGGFLLSCAVMCAGASIACVREMGKVTR